jgi:hypothetical protein
MFRESATRRPRAQRRQTVQQCQRSRLSHSASLSYRAALSYGAALSHRAGLGLLFALVLHACQSGSAPQSTRAFYYWRTTLSLSEGERHALATLRTGKVYLRLFDVVANSQGGVATLGHLQLPAASEMPPMPEVVPVVFLHNESFLHSPPPSPARLASDVWEKTTATLQTRGPLQLAQVRELQLDCDWTDKTQDQYFDFLRALRKRAPPSMQLSATIRLHQVKFRERTGVPPVDSGMLMFYNMGRFDSGASERAIFDANVAERYLERLDDYPLPLDVALPIWSWTLQLRDDRVVGLLQYTDPAELPYLDFVAARAEQRFEVLRTTFLHGQLLRQGDVLEGETLDQRDLATAAKLLESHLPRVTKPRTVALFDLSDRNLERHRLDTLEDTLATIR